MARHRLALLQALAATLSVVSFLVAFSPLAVTSPANLVEVVGDPRVKRAVILSLVTASLAATLSVAIGLPAAYYISRRGGFLARLAASSSLLLLGLPPVGLGLSILIAFKYTPLKILEEAVRVTFTVKGIVLAQALVVAPLSASLLVNAFSYVPSTVEDLARVYGASSPLALARILIPAVSPGILAAWVLSFFRAVGEFGASLVVGGGAPGYTETLPIAMYNKLAVADVEAAGALMLLTVLIGVAAVSLYVKLYGMLEEKSSLLNLSR